mgnify:CR=1 FL=1
MYFGATTEGINRQRTDNHKAMEYTQDDAHAIGYSRGRTAAIHCETEPGESRKGAAFAAEMNARQYAGHLPVEIAEERDLFTAYRNGVAEGIDAELV